MKKSFWMLLGGGLIIALVYYIILRPFEYAVNFEAATIPGDLIETIRIWNRSLDNAKVVQVDSFDRLKQTIILKNRSYVYDWHFKPISDSLTKVTIQISEPNRRFWNKLMVPFTNQPIKDDASHLGGMFYEIIQTHLKITKVKILGEDRLDSSFCICRSLETDQILKANAMMMDYSLIVSFIDTHKLKASGPPMIKVSEWDHGAGKLKFDFCFPLQPIDTLPLVTSLKFKKFKEEFALKAEYRGNYITSDRAWYQLIDYANRKGYKTIGTPIEIFHDNPNMGLNEANWKADIYLPILK
jgi:GyrI-like small molecule binding domain